MNIWKVKEVRAIIKYMREVAHSIINLPIAFFAVNNTKSIKALLEESGYHQLLDQSKVNKDLVSILANNPDKVDHWLEWSESKRSDEGWFITKKNNHYQVGYFKDNQISEMTHYQGKVEACAAFIINEVNSIVK